MKYVDAGDSKSFEYVKNSIAAGIRHQEKYGYQHWAVIEIDSKHLIGSCGFNKAAQPGEIELVFHFAKAFWGKGYATEAAKSCLEHAFRTLNPTKVIAGCHPQNKSSIGVLKKIGFTFMGNKWFEDSNQEEPYFELINL